MGHVDPVTRIAEAMEALVAGSHVRDSLWRIERGMETLLMAARSERSREGKLMALSQEILDKVEANRTLIGSIKTLIEGFISNGSITAEQGRAIMTALSVNTEDLKTLESALLANVPPVEPPPVP